MAEVKHLVGKVKLIELPLMDESMGRDIPWEHALARSHAYTACMAAGGGLHMPTWSLAPMRAC
eukprot:352170-Chlamydomonas_euryale.AAC.2